MDSNKAVKYYQIENFLISKAEIDNDKIETNEIFELTKEDTSLGFIKLSDLKLVNTSNQMDWEGYKLRAYESIEWKNVYEHPSFQRRKPQIVNVEPAATSEDEVYYLLVRGQKKGPYSKNEMKQFVDKKEILLTDLISSNAGHTWNKIYQVDGFERRHLKENEALPGLPKNDFFNGTEYANENKSETVDALSGLAYLGNLKRGKAQEREREENLETVIAKNNKTNWIYKGVLVGSIFGILYMGYSLKNSLKSPFNDSHDESRLGEKNDSNDLNGEELTPTKNKNMFNNSPGNDFKRSAKFETRQLNPVRKASNPRSFSSTRKFGDASQNSVNFENNGSDEQNYYYNDSAPMELDPVRNQISRETSENAAVGEPMAAPANDPLFNQEVEN